MSTRSTSTNAVAALAVGLIFLLTAQIAWAEKPDKKPPKGGDNTPPLVTVAILDVGTITQEFEANGVWLTSVGGDLYVDERAGGARGVESFLFGSGNFGLRLEGSERLVNLRFGEGVSLDSCLRENPLPYEKNTWPVKVHELANLRIADIENCEDGLLCIDPGETHESGLYLKWEDPEFPNTQFSFSLASGSLAGAVLITRHTDPSLPSWTITTTEEPNAAVCVTSRSLKGKPRGMTYGWFELVLDLVVSCVNSDCS